MTKNGGSTMEKFEALEIFKRFGTPVFMFDERILKSRIEYLRRNLPQKIKLCYAVKANAFIVPCVSELVERLEICSPGEYSICKRYGVPTAKMVISGVNKTPGWIQQVIEDDLRDNGSCHAVYTIESILQGRILENAAQKSGITLSVLLRYSSGNQFGMDAIDLTEFVRTQRESYPHLLVEGIQYFSGTQRHSMKKNARELAAVCKLMDELEQTYGVRCKELEYGTGFPVSYFQGNSFEEETFLQEFSELILPLSSTRKVTLEIGRSIAASCGSYAAKVVDLKTVFGHNYAILDGGIHQLVYYGQTMAMRHPYYELYRGDRYAAPDEETVEWNLCGSLCTINDILVKELPVKGLREGDIFLFHNTGAYSITEGIALFLSRQLPKVVLIKETGETVLVRDAIETSTFNG